MQPDGNTHRSLMAAFRDEAVTVQRYLAFAGLAEAEGHTEIAALFRELAESASLNAQGHLDWLRRASDPSTGLPMGPTADNLRSALVAESTASTTTYPDRSAEALAEGLTDVASWLDCMATYKKSHLERFTEALDALSHGGTP